MTEPRSPAERRLYELWSEYCDLQATEALLEWDQDIPSFEETHAEALKAHRWRDEVLEASPQAGAPS